MVVLLSTRDGVGVRGSCDRALHIGSNDLLIASIALANDLTLVTYNTGEFSRVEGLLVEDWEVGG